MADYGYYPWSTATMGYVGPLTYADGSVCLRKPEGAHYVPESVKPGDELRPADLPAPLRAGLPMEWVHSYADGVGAWSLELLGAVDRSARRLYA